MWFVVAADNFVFGGVLMRSFWSLDEAMNYCTVLCSGRIRRFGKPKVFYVRRMQWVK